MAGLVLFVLISLYCSVIPGHPPGKAPTHQNGFSFASYYADHMVLQKSPQKANVWGYSTKIGDSVYITVNNNTLNSTVTTQVVMGPEGKGVWKTALPAVDAGGPYTVTATSSLATLVLHDVLFGDVWICSGQSNMQFTLTMDTDKSTDEITDSANFPNIRVFTVSQRESNTVHYDLMSVEENWSLPSKESLGGRAWSHFSSLCWHYGKNLYKKLNYPIGLIASDWGGTLVESWSSPDASAKCGSTFFNYGLRSKQPHVLWNSMINPLLPFTIYGVIWYQGESNYANPNGYNCSFPAMIDDWRVKFNKASGGQTSKKFPFGFVQLAAYRNQSNYRTGFTDIRIAQTAGYGYVPNNRMSNIFMAVALDLPDFKAPFGSVHPRHKDIVANRLTLGAMSVAYHRPGIMFQGPYPSKIINSKKLSTITIHYNHDKSPLHINDNDGFEVCCTREVRGSGCKVYDSSWQAVPIATKTQYTVTLQYPNLCHQGDNHANAIRYLWTESPCSFLACPIYSVNNHLPAPPFQQFLQDDDHHIVG